MNQHITPSDASSSFYAKHKKVYPREVHGIFATFRTLGVLVLLGSYYFVPWITWEGHQAVLFDLPARKFYIFGLIFWPQDFFYLAALLIIAAFALFFFTALAGRLWCGYACPQTVWTEAFLWIERKIEGDRNKQIKLDNAPFSGGKFNRKFIKHFIWISFSLWTGFTFVGYFTPILALGREIATLNLGGWETFWVIFYSFATYGNAGWMREQVCIYMCPYARFQSAMFDKDTLIISYDKTRGEPRGARKKGPDPRTLALGDCVDCTLCVQVCPTGIDIRDGLQYQCIGCAACIDVCNEVMDKMQYPRKLIKYTTQHAVDGYQTHLLRPRVIIYAVLLAIISVALIYSISTRLPLKLDILRDRNTLYRVTPEGLIENSYTLKLINMDKIAHRYTLTVAGLADVNLSYRAAEIRINAGDDLVLPVQLTIDPAKLAGLSQKISFTLTAQDNSKLTLTQSGVFVGPRTH
jgi:cytochrome c oxidase accessory protein FixG